MDNSTPAQKEKQRAHAAKIAAERKVMEITGLTRSQLRTRLAAFGQTNQFVAAALAARERERAPFSQETVKEREASVAPRGFGPAGEAGGNARGVANETAVFVAIEEGTTMKLVKMQIHNSGFEEVED